MKTARFGLWISVLALVAVAGFGCGGSGSGSGGGGGQTFVQANLVSDVAGSATFTDPNVVNAWGIAHPLAGPFWISDNGTGKSSLFDGTGASAGPAVTIPAVGGGSTGRVTGQVFNATADFVIPASGPSSFIFDSLDGSISAWYAGASAVTVANRAANGAVYTGLAMGSSGGANFLFAANFKGATVDVFDKNFTFVKSFGDATIPSGYAPYGIANIGGQLYVTYAQPNPAMPGVLKGAGLGYVDVFGTDGTFVKHLISQGSLNAPWGMALAPVGFGSFGNALLVGNFGDGHINAFNLATGASMGTLTLASGSPVAIDGLWGLSFGNGAGAGATGTLYFTAGPVNETHGLFGSVAAGP